MKTLLQTLFSLLLLTQICFGQVYQQNSSTMFTVTTTADTGAGSLRQAFLDANWHFGVDTIVFNIPGTGVRTISVNSGLPDIVDPVVVDGLTQPGTNTNSWPPTLLIEIDGSNAGPGASGLTITGSGSGSTVRGLIINRFGINGFPYENGISLYSTSHNVIQCNFIGTSADGLLAEGNGDGGIAVFESHKNTIGGPQINHRNLVSGNKGHGFDVAFGSSGNIIQGNMIGTDVNGRPVIGNGQGVLVNVESINNMIGGMSPLLGNIIAGNGICGVNIAGGSTRNAILGNCIYSNGGLGIGLDNEIVLNDSCDGDTGPNDLQNFPVLSHAIAASESTLIVGTFNGAPNAEFHLEFFVNDSCDLTRYGEGKIFIGSIQVITNTECNASFEFSVSQQLPVGKYISATSTDADNNTSGFSACIVVEPLSSVPDTKDLLPMNFSLEQNCPNPFNPSTVIGYQLPVSNDVTLKVFDILGNEIVTLVDEYKPAGKYEVEFNATNLPSGVYFYRLKAGEYTAVKKMILIK